MLYEILDKDGKEVRIPSFIREHLSSDLIMYQDIFLGSREYKIAAERNSITLMIFKEVDNGIYKLISENEYTWGYWFKHYFKYVKIVNWLRNNDYILIAN